MTSDEAVDALPEERIVDILKAIARSVEANGSADHVPSILADWSLIERRPRYRPSELQQRLDSANESNDALRKEVARLRNYAIHENVSSVTGVRSWWLREHLGQRFPSREMALEALHEATGG